METTTNATQDTTTATDTADTNTGPQGPGYARTPALTRPVRGAVLAVAGPGVPLYLAGWLLIPDQGARQSVAADVIDSISYRDH